MSPRARTPLHRERRGRPADRRRPARAADRFRPRPAGDGADRIPRAAEAAAASGRLDAGAIATTDPDRLLEVFREKPAIHRFPGNMAKRVQELCAVDRRGVRRRRGPRLGRRHRHGRPEAAARGAAGLRRDEGEGARLGARRRYGIAMAEPLVPDHAMLGDVDSPEALAEYQAAKRALQGAASSRSRLIDLRFYRDGGQSAVDVANEVAEFLGGRAHEPRARALRHPTARGRGEIVTQALVGAQDRGIAVRLVYNVDHPARSRSRRRPRPRPSCSKHSRSRRARSRACPT